MLDDKKHSKPTRKNITDAFKEMAKVSEPGDVVFCHFSGHGGKIRDFDGDEGTLATLLWVSIAEALSSTKHADSKLLSMLNIFPSTLAY